MVLVFAVGLLPFLPQVTNIYLVASLSREITISILATAICINIPYSNIASKCSFIGFTIIQYLNLIFAFMYAYFYFELPEYLTISIYLSVFIFAIFFGIQLTKKYKYSNEQIDQSKIYYLCPKADDLNGLLSSLFYVPFSGVKVYCNGNVYAYKRGVLKKFTGRRSLFYISRCLAFDTKVNYSESIELELDELVGQKWSYSHNCYSTFEPLFGTLKSKMR